MRSASSLLLKHLLELNRIKTLQLKELAMEVGFLRFTQCPLSLTEFSIKVTMAGGVFWVSFILLSVFH